MSFNQSEAAKLVGAESGAIPALDRVTKSDIRHWCEVIGDADPDYAEKIKQGAKTAPPAMTMVWSQPPLWPPSEASEPHEKLLRMLDEAGYKGTAGVKLEQEFQQPIRIGDRLSFTVKVAGLSQGEEATKMGKGYLVDLHYAIRDGRGQVVSTQTYTVFKFRSLELPS
ncbi:MAG: MaoC family dehydratase N-terminal domain-containing protein [Deltaproteobacteria bacterium]|nr:MaoC family dehydratase N-terminal domain-containing protein [Deltaproteobacteria bacterium]